MTEAGVAEVVTTVEAVEVILIRAEAEVVAAIPVEAAVAGPTSKWFWRWQVTCEVLTCK